MREVYESVAVDGVREVSHDDVDRLFGVDLGEDLCSREAGGGVDGFDGGVDVTGALELPLDHGVECRKLLGSEEDGSRRDSELEVGEGGLSRRCYPALEVENVVDELEGAADVLAVQVGGLDLGGAVVAENGGRHARVGHEGGSL